jgi:hypothetical protein
MCDRFVSEDVHKQIENDKGRRSTRITGLWSLSQLQFWE